MHKILNNDKNYLPGSYTEKYSMWIPWNMTHITYDLYTYEEYNSYLNNATTI